MRAEQVWSVWRRLLSEPALAEAAFTGRVRQQGDAFGLTPGEIEICLAYGETPKHTGWFVTNYRYRLVSSVCFAIETCAPLTWRRLLAHGMQMRDFAAAFLDAEGWHDDGPYVYRACGRALQHLALHWADRVPFLADTLALESVAVRLVQDLANAGPADFAPAGGPAEITLDAASRMRRRRVGRVATTPHSLSAWLRDLSQIGRAPLPPGPQAFLVYLPSPQSPVKYLGIGSLGAALFEALAEVRTVAELSALAQGTAAGDAAVASALQRFVRLGVVERLGT